MQLHKALLSVITTGAILAAGTVAFASGNSTTGPDSVNRNISSISSDSSIDINNTSSAIDDFNFDVEAGRSIVERNTVVGSVSTGDVTGMVSVSHAINNGTISMSDDDSDFMFPDFNMSNHLTGPDSTNLNKVNVALNRSVNISNCATYNANYDVNANTGRNIIMRNTQVGNVSGGDVNIGISENVTNNGGASSINIPSMSGINLSTGSMDNSITGPDSTNSNIMSVEADQNVSVTNTSEVVNNVQANINTGRNTIERNTVVGDVRTGSVNFNLNFSSNGN